MNDRTHPSEDAPLSPDATRTLALFGAGLRLRDAPPAVLQQLKRCVLDALGCCVFGANLPWTKIVAAMIEEQGGRPEASIFGTSIRTSASFAALANCTAGHAFELDDIHRAAIFHPNSVTVPVALNLAERQGGVTGRALLTAILAGYEVGTRIGRAAGQALFFRGFHPQGTSGTFAAAATAARSLGLTPVQTQNALGIAGSQAAGLMAAQEGADVKRFHSGRAAQSGVYAALLAQRGFTGIGDIVEAPYGGFLSSYAGAPDASRLVADLGASWEVLTVGFKMHAAVTSIHTALDGLRSIMDENRLTASDIDRIDVAVSSLTHKHCAWPYNAKSVTSAQMNLYFGLAVMALDGQAFVDQYRAARLSDPKVLALVNRIEAHIDPAIDARGAEHRHACTITVTTHDGRSVAKEVLRRHGGPESPVSAAGIERKFRALVKRRLPNETADKIIDLVNDLEHLDDTNRLVALLRISAKKHDTARRRSRPNRASSRRVSSLR